MEEPIFRTTRRNKKRSSYNLTDNETRARLLSMVFYKLTYTGERGESSINKCCQGIEYKLQYSKNNFENLAIRKQNS